MEVMIKTFDDLYNNIPLEEEQLYKGPGRPLIVYASDTFGPPPV